MELFLKNALFLICKELKQALAPEYGAELTNILKEKSNSEHFISGLDCVIKIEYNG